MSADLPGLDQLRELPLPAPVPYWPQTWGWAVLAVVVCGLAVYAVLAWARGRRRNLYRRQAFAELARIRREAAAQPLAARQLPDLLKRTALAARGVHAGRAAPQRGAPASFDPAGSVAALSGRAWMAYLAQDMGEMARRGGQDGGQDTPAPDADDRHPATSAPSSTDSVRLLPILAYAPDAAVRDIDPAALDRLFDASLCWMERHHVAA